MMALMEMQLPQLPPRLTYSLVEAALMMGLSLSTINRRLASGELKSVKIGRRRLVPTAELTRICSASSTTTATLPVSAAAAGAPT